MQDGQVPWRCLVPADAESFIVGHGGQNLRQIKTSTGADVAFSKEGEAPDTLADKIVTIKGLVEAKEAAVSTIVQKLRHLQGVSDPEPAVFVVIVPQHACPVIVGAKGAQVRAIMQLSGAEINIGRETIIGMPDQPICIHGTLAQVVSAVKGLNEKVQDMADRGKVSDKDFIYRPEPVTYNMAAADEDPWAAPPPAAPLAQTLPEESQKTTTSSGWANSRDPEPAPAQRGWANSRDPEPPTAQRGEPVAPKVPPAAEEPAASHHRGGMGLNGGVAGMTAPARACPSAEAPGPAGVNGAFGGAPSAAAAALGTGGTGAAATSFSPAVCASTAAGSTSFSPAASSFGGQGGGSLNGSGVGGPTSFGPAGMASGSNPNAMLNANGPTSFGPAGAGGLGAGGAVGGGFGGGMGGAGGLGGFGGMPGAAGGGLGMGAGFGGGLGLGAGALGAGGLGFGGFGGMGGGLGMAGFGGMGLGNPMMGMGGLAASMANSERAFLNALQASGINNAQLTLLLPQALVHNLLIPRGIMAEIAQRSGSKIDLGSEVHDGMIPTTLSGSMMGNALASLYLQEAAIQFQS